MYNCHLFHFNLQQGHVTPTHASQLSIVCADSVTGRASKIVQHTHRLCTYVTVRYASGFCDYSRLCCIITLYMFCIKQIGCGRGPCTVYDR